MHRYSPPILRGPHRHTIPTAVPATAEKEVDEKKRILSRTQEDTIKPPEETREQAKKGINDTRRHRKTRARTFAQHELRDFPDRDQQVPKTRPK
jgi:hypothetical protein